MSSSGVLWWAARVASMAALSPAAYPVRGEFHRAVGEPTADGGVAAYARIVTEHLLVFPDRDVAEQTADELRDEGFTEVRVLRQPLAGEDDAEADEWAVYVREANVADETGPVAAGLRDRFSALVEEHDGWYDPDPEPRYA